MPTPPRVATAAPDINAKFDPRLGGTGNWLGGDVAFSLPLGDGRVVWLFGDTHWKFPEQPSPPTSRRDGYFTNDSIAIQTGMDPATADFAFYSHVSRTNLFEIPGGTHYAWAQSAILLGGTLYVWSQRVLASDPTVDAGWCLHRQQAVLTADPGLWNPELLYQSGDTDLRPVHSPYEFLGYVYAFALKHGEGWRLARWPGANISAGTVGTPEYLSGSTWTTNAATATQISPSTLAGEGSIHQVPDGRWLLAETSVEFPHMKVVLRVADQVGGPYRELETPFVYDPPENTSKPDSQVYAGRAHKWMPGGLLVLSYCDNRPWLTAGGQPIDGGIADDLSTYWPKFIRVLPRAL